MRVRTLAATAAIAAAAALTLAACGGGGSGDSDGSDKIASSSAGSAGSSMTPPTTSPATSRGAAPLRIDPSLVLPADLKAVFDWTMPADRTRAAALSGAANYLQAIDHAVAEQDGDDAGLHAFASADALSYARHYVRENVADKETLTGTDRYYQPSFTEEPGGTSVEIKLCNNQSKLYSKVIATGKVHVTQASDEDYALFDIVMVKVPSATELWQANGITVKESALQCKE